jgi:glutamate/tyrosine decarboxylase-like PLP-dependent enzyme
MKIPEHGLSEEAVFARLEEYRAHDTDWRAGRTFGYVFDAGREIEEIAKRAYMAFLSENALDPTIYPSLLRIENELVGMALEHLSAPAGAAGNFTSGGTESILLAVKAARDAFRARHPEVSEPELVLPVTAHAAFHKAAHYLGVKVVPTPVEPGTYRADVAALRSAISPRTMLLVGSAPSYACGVIDPIAEIGALALEKGVLFHVDACIGGFLLPYLRRLGQPVRDFDFSVPGVTSMSMDLHKYAYCAKGASVVLFRDKELRRHMIFACSRWTGYTMVNTTVQSTKSGGPMAAAWAVLHHVGDAGYLAIAEKLAAGMRELCATIRSIPELRLLGEPDMTLCACASDSLDVFALADAMKDRGWYIQPQLGQAGAPASFHLSLQPSNVPRLPELARDLADAVREVRALPPSETADAVREVFAAIDPDTLGPEMFTQMLAMAGVGAVGIPEHTAEINRILSGLPPAITERLLIEFVNELFSASR